ncbi:transmembrane protein 62-like isoform X2 [Cylas formicarius]|uniref:transmembrane protein 62-like isoform X2 n=1 Tax=Cylas formicarius TaxID=197179 RepID=UPI002958AE9D|nr:transmembrane protein 62-like isoform X2 [Cylas formicarius]
MKPVSTTLNIQIIMKVPKSALGAFVSVILLSIFFANIINLISTTLVHPKDHTKERFFKIGDKFDNLIWILQITDIHVSIFQDPSRITEFKEFCHYTIDRIRPSLVLASGDLTDAKTKDAIGSQQHEPEWRHYRDILKEYDITNKTRWLDIRGNHDNFNVADIKSKQNYFSNYSVQGKEHPRSYMIQLRKGKILYSFIGVDACLEPGPRRPFNFVGVIDEAEVQQINKLIKKAGESGSNYTIWFGHFPTSCILSSGSENIRDLIKKDKNGMVYVCGHLHTLGGLIPSMYSMQKGGFLELELGDWKDNRMYRLLTIDHGMFSFVDIPHRSWPVGVVTNPKHALFLNPLKENLENIQQSTHIRVLAFSLARIRTVRVRVDHEPWTDCKHIKGPLYVVSWDPQRYSSGLHQIELFVKDIDGRELYKSQPFSLDGTRLSFGVLPRIALMSNASDIFQGFFISTVIIYSLPLFLLKYFHNSILGNEKRLKARDNCLNKWLKKLWVLTTVDRIFWPVILYPIYLMIGPWSVGYIVEDHIGVIFAWGIFVNGAFLPGSFTYMYGFIQLVTFQLPFTLIMVNLIYYRFQQLSLKSGKKLKWKESVWLHLPFSVVFTTQVIMAYLFWLAYGALAFFLGPLRTWSLVLASVLYFWALHLPENHLRYFQESNRSLTN